MFKRFETPGLFAGSYLISLPLSVMAVLNFFITASGSSIINTQPWGEDLLILAVGSCKSRILADSLTMNASGTTNV